MAAFLTANRWSSGIGTHKTKEGRILCTGVGCLGCFPETNQSEAEEVGLCDVDMTGPYPFRTFLNDDVAKHGTPRNQTRQSITKKIHKQSLKKSINFGKSVNENAAKDKEEFDKTNFRNAATQTQELDDKDTGPNVTGLSRETQQVLYSMIGSPRDVQGLEDNSENSPMCQQRLTCKVRQTMEHSTANRNINYNTAKSDSFNRQVNKTARILDALYLISKDDTAVNVHDDILPMKHNILENSPWDLGENAVCLYFAIQYFDSERVLPEFKVLEIVESLSDCLPANDIKCVQKVAGMWQIVLRTRKYLPYFRKMGLKIRGRDYKLVDDIDSYCDVICG